MWQFPLHFHKKFQLGIKYMMLIREAKNMNQLHIDYTLHRV